MRPLLSVYDTGLIAPADDPAAAADHPAALQGRPPGPILHSRVCGTLNGAQDVVPSADDALNKVPATVGPVPLATAVPAQPQSSPQPVDPVGVLMQGHALPGLPGADLLLKPFLDLLCSLGAGDSSALDLATILSKSSKVIDVEMKVGVDGEKTVDLTWLSKPVSGARTAWRNTNLRGEDTKDYSLDIFNVLEQAAAVVQTGNVRLTAIVRSFAVSMAAAAPTIMRPTTQAALIASATENLGLAVAVVNATHGELAGYMAQLDGVLQRIFSASGSIPRQVTKPVGVDPGEVIRSMVEDGLQSSETTSISTADQPNSDESVAIQPELTAATVLSLDSVRPGSPEKPIRDEFAVTDPD
ncbi:hypothetical protein ACQP1G_17370 [Nocardia sp. CA-107356]|uniref:hypothetical protein n=1 Tax=Nocardia sp. CA-107356 TaxID=3239972 RepID=UPI003D8DDC98